MILTLYNEKGGVGKTTNTIHIGAALATMNKTVLLVDLDTQCDLTTGCGITNPTYTVKNLLDGTGTVKLRSRSDNFTILAGDPEVIGNDYKSDALRNSLEAWKAHFDYILIDCPPQTLNTQIVTLPELALTACDSFIIPLEAAAYAVTNSEKVLRKVVDIIKPKNPNLKFSGFVFGKILSTATNRNGIYMDMMSEKAPGSIFKTYIRTDTEVENAIMEGKTIFQHRPNCRAAMDFISLTNEIIEKTS